jgi:hypothetical protein
VSPLTHFREVWDRCSQLSAIHAYLTANATSVLPLDELLRAEWVARVSALDMYIHELVSQKIIDIYDGNRPITPSFLQFKISIETLTRIRSASILTDAKSAFELEIRSSLARITYQDPETIADGIRLISMVELWNELVIIIGRCNDFKQIKFGKVLKDLSLIVSRRNKIAHEGDLQPTPPRQPWAISRADLEFVTVTIESIVNAIDITV